jgi:murein DD-endopeptidase MepM/ murein hydrolase activator NlpD
VKGLVAFSILVLGAPPTPVPPTLDGQPAERSVEPTTPPATQSAILLDVSYPADGLHTGRAELLSVTVPPSTPPIAELIGSIDGKALVVFPASADRRQFLALAAVDIDGRVGARPLKLTAKLDDGAVLQFDQAVPVVEAPYDVRALSVDRRFIHPNKTDRLRAAREARVFERALKTSDRQRHWRGSFARPAEGAETSPFGTKRTYNNKTSSRHLGWDLDGKVGDAVVATQAGRVALSADRFYSGGTLVIDHGQGLFSLYFHLSRRDVAAGQRVAKGQPLGAIGATGRVTGPHLHFTIKLAGASVDPKQLLQLDLSRDVEPPERTRPNPTPSVSGGARQSTAADAR